MDLKSAIGILSIHNEWRRDNTGEFPPVQPKILGEAIDLIVSEFDDFHLTFDKHSSLPDGFKVYKCSNCKAINVKHDNGRIRVGFCDECNHPLWN